MSTVSGLHVFVSRMYLNVYTYTDTYVGQCNGLASQTVLTVLTCLRSQSEHVH